MAVPVDPRPLSEAERAVLTRILSAEFPGSAELLGQLDRAEVHALWSEGSVSVDIQVPGATATNGLSGPVPVRALVDETGEILVWVTNGVLSALEYAWYTDEPPVSLPSPNQISFA